MKSEIVVAIAVILIIGGLAFLFLKLGAPVQKSVALAPPANSTGPVFPINVTLHGSVAANASGITPQNIRFTTYNGSTYIAKIAKGAYSISLKNAENYNMTVDWNGTYPWQYGDAYAGTIWLDQLAGMSANKSYDIRFTYPNSTILVKGNVTTPYDTTPNTITFSYYNRVYTAKITVKSTYNVTGNVNYTIPRGNYSVRLPNWTNYTVVLYYRGIVGWSKTCVAGSLYEEVTTQISNNIETDYYC